MTQVEVEAEKWLTAGKTWTLYQVILSQNRILTWWQLAGSGLPRPGAAWRAWGSTRIKLLSPAHFRSTAIQNLFNLAENIFKYFLTSQQEISIVWNSFWYLFYKCYYIVDIFLHTACSQLNVDWILHVHIWLVEVVPEVAHHLNLQDGLRVFNLEPIREKAHYTEDQVAQKYPRISQLAKNCRQQIF